MLSATDLSTYLFCQRKLFLKKVLKLEEPQAPVMLKGSVVHKAIELMLKSEENFLINWERDPNVANYMRFTQNQLSTAIHTFRMALKMQSIVPSHMFQDASELIIPFAQTRLEHIKEATEIAKCEQTSVWEALRPKIKTEYRITSENLQLKGIIDQLEVHTDKLIPVELKTGATPTEGLFEGHEIQLGSYAVLLENHFGMPVPFVKIHYLGSQQTRVLPVLQTLKDKVHTIKDKSKDLLLLQTVPERCKEESKCNACGLQKQCFNDSWIESKFTNAKTAAESIKAQPLNSH